LPRGFALSDIVTISEAASRAQPPVQIPGNSGKAEWGGSRVKVNLDKLREGNASEAYTEGEEVLAMRRFIAVDIQCLEDSRARRSAIHATDIQIVHLMACACLDFMRNRNQDAEHRVSVGVGRVIVARYDAVLVHPYIRYEVGTGVEPGLGSDQEIDVMADLENIGDTD
jgi:hypothetical protein